MTLCQSYVLSISIRVAVPFIINLPKVNPICLTIGLTEETLQNALDYTITGTCTMRTKPTKLWTKILIEWILFKLIAGWGHTSRNMNININDPYPEPPNNQQTYSNLLQMGQS